jgi:hypothetical protein
MRRTLIALTSALALAAAPVAMPTAALANPVLLIPALIGVGVGGLGLGAASGASAQQHNDTVVAPQRQDYVARPAPALQAACYWTTGRVHGIWRRVEVCD